MLYSEAIREHFANPRNAGELEQPDAVGTGGTPGEGPYVVMQLRVEDGRVADIRFLCHGCAASIAAASMLTELAKGRSLGECSRLSEDDVVAVAGGFPLGREYAPGLAVGALREALAQLGLVVAKMRSKEG